MDVLPGPARALADRVLVTPTLISLMPPVRRIVGMLRQPDPVLQTPRLAFAAA